MTISAGMVKDLREKTGVGMMECKKALEENGGDMEKAILWLRERGMSRAAKKADRVAAEGMVEVLVNEDHNAGVLVELNCETDFVSKNDDFKKFAHDMATLALKTQPKNVDDLLKQKFGAETVDTVLKGLIGKIGENLVLRRVQTIKVNNGTVAGYSHMGGKIGTLVAIEGAKNVALAKDIAMHTAAAFPRYLVPEQVDNSELEQEKELARKKLAEENKPKDLIEKIVAGQMNKFYKEVCLLEQVFVKDPNITIKKLVDEQAKGGKLTAFGRFQLGEGIEKKKDDFAAEVAAAVKGS